MGLCGAQVLTVLQKIDDWQFDAFKLNEVSGGRPLSLLSYALLKHHGLVDTFKMDDHRLVKFLMRIEDGYPNNPYHNRIHAADVLQSLHVLIVRGGLKTPDHPYCDDVSLASCYLSAVRLSRIPTQSSAGPCRRGHRRHGIRC